VSCVVIGLGPSAGHSPPTRHQICCPAALPTCSYLQDLIRERTVRAQLVYLRLLPHVVLSARQTLYAFSGGPFTCSLVSFTSAFRS
jgi:hypothetical protein